MNFEETTQHFIEEYKKLGLSEVPSLGITKDLYFKYKDSQLDITEDEIETYRTYIEQLSSFQINPNECSICNLNYREQAIDEWNPRFFMPMSDKKFCEFKKDGHTIVEIGTASDIYIEFFRFNKDFISASIPNFKLRNSERYLMSELIRRPITIKVFELNSETIETTIKKSNPMIEAALFDLAFLKKRNYAIRDKWVVERIVRKRLTFDKPTIEKEFRFRNIEYNSDLIRFYQRGIGSRDSVSQFLAFYQVLEYFFVKVSDENLYEKLTRRINTPQFSTKHKNLDLIIKDTLEHKKETDETEMLKMVISKYIDEDELLLVLKLYEDSFKENSYLKKQKIFGEEIEIKLNKGQVIGNLSKRIKTVRNALVHSSDRYERNERFIPTAENERKIEIEIPIIKYLAERVIINSAVTEN